MSRGDVAVVLCSKVSGVAAHVREVAPAVQDWDDAVRATSMSVPTVPSNRKDYIESLENCSRRETIQSINRTHKSIQVTAVNPMI